MKKEIEEIKIESKNYLTRQLKNPKEGEKHFEQLIEELGAPIDSYPEWHPILTTPMEKDEYRNDLRDLYPGVDHTRLFVKGLITCPYSKATAKELIKMVSSMPGLIAYEYEGKLYHDSTHPVIIKSLDIETNDDGTIENRQVLQRCLTSLIKSSYSSTLSESWFSLKDSILGVPNKNVSSLFVSATTGSHIKKILTAMNNSGIYGPPKDWYLEKLSEKQKHKIATTIIRAAIEKQQTSYFEFELNGEICKTNVNDTFSDGSEFYFTIEIGDYALWTSAFYYPQKNLLQICDIRGKQALANKFL